MCSVLIVAATFHYLSSTYDAASACITMAPTTPSAATASAASAVEVSEAPQPDSFAGCYRRPPTFPDMTVYFQQTIEAIAAASSVNDTSLEAIFAGSNNSLLSCVDSRCDFTTSGTNCSGQIWKVNLTEMNDHLCQSTSSWLQNNSDVTPSSRSEAVVRARGLDLIFVAAVCVVVGVPVLSLVVTCIVKHCRSIRRHPNSRISGTLSACHQDHRQRQTTDGDKCPPLNKINSVHDLIACGRDAGETGSARELLTSADGDYCAPSTSTPPGGSDALNPFAFSSVFDSSSLPELSVRGIEDNVDTISVSYAPDAEASSKL